MRFTLAAVIGLALAVPAQADSLSEADVKRLALEAILENPGIVMEAVQILQDQEAEALQASAIEALRAEREALLAGAPVVGNPSGDGVIIEFFDYNCPYCRRAKPALQALLDEDDDLQIVFREWPILGEGSVFAARAALAAREQDLYEEFHFALMGINGRAEKPSVMRVAEEVGLDIDRLLADMEAPEIDAHIEESTRLAALLGFNGTPSFVIGETLIPGLVEKDDLARAVEDARASAD